MKTFHSILQLDAIDLDGIVADNAERAHCAQQAQEAYLKKHADDTKGADRAYYDTLLDPRLVALDTLIPEADLAIAALQKAGHQVMFLTSRPEWMRDATIHWLIKQGFAPARFGWLEPEAWLQWLWMMPAVARKNFQNTATWKAGVIETLFYTFEIPRILVVDDSEKNVERIGQIQDLPQWEHLKIVTSLSEAIQTLV